MAADAVAICNMALGRIGHRQAIASLEAGSTEARACNRFYAESRDFVLASHWWRFATMRAELELIEGGERSGWAYAYAMPEPEDFIAAQYLWPGQRFEQTPPELRIPYTLEHDATGDGRVVLLTDKEDAELVYTARIEYVPLYPPHFVDALTWQLASNICLEISVKPPVAKLMLDKAEQRIAWAIAADKNQGQADPPPEPESIRVR